MSDRAGSAGSPLNVLVVGSGGREHAICWALAADPTVGRIYAAPGNPGIRDVAGLVPIPATDVHALADFAARREIGLTVVGPEAPLVGGIVDEFEARGLLAFGPRREGATIEGSKVWASGLCERHGIPAPRAGEFRDVNAALEHVERMEPPFVVKADGLAAGKGVAVVQSRAEAGRALKALLVDKALGEAGERVLVQEYLEGIEISALALTDGLEVIELELAQDYKRVGEGDTGPNTGGMGAFSPLPFVSPDAAESIQGILRATVKALRAEGIRYRGVLYAGLMLTGDGPKVLEFNCRFGDPETQVVLPRLRSGLAGVLLACAEGNLSGRRLEWKQEACVGVVLAAGGYPGRIEAGKPIVGLEDARERDGVFVFQAGTATGGDRVVTAGGRVATVSALGADLDEARTRAYQACSLIEFEGMRFRRDIGERVPQEAV